MCIIEFIDEVLDKLDEEPCTPQAFMDIVIESDKRLKPARQWPGKAQAIWDCMLALGATEDDQSAVEPERFSFYAGLIWAKRSLQEREDSITPWALYDVLSRAIDQVPEIERLGYGARLLAVRMLGLAQVAAREIGGEQLGDDLREIGGGAGSFVSLPPAPGVTATEVLDAVGEEAAELARSSVIERVQRRRAYRTRRQASHGT
jgi:hypothetical protein